MSQITTTRLVICKNNNQTSKDRHHPHINIIIAVKLLYKMPNCIGCHKVVTIALSQAIYKSSRSRHKQHVIPSLRGRRRPHWPCTTKENQDDELDVNRNHKEWSEDLPPGPDVRKRPSTRLSTYIRSKDNTQTFRYQGRILTSAKNTFKIRMIII